MSRIRGLAGRSRAFVKERPKSQKVTALGAVALLLTAPFGGLREAESPPVETAKVGQEFRVGPYEITVHRARTVADLKPTVSPSEESRQLLVFVITLENVTDRTEAMVTLSKELDVEGGDVLVDGAYGPGIYQLQDGQRASWVSPDLPLELAVVFEQPKGWDAKRATLTFPRMEWVAEDTLGLDPESWRVWDTRPGVAVTVPVKQATSEPAS